MTVLVPIKRQTAKIDPISHVKGQSRWPAYLKINFTLSSMSDRLGRSRQTFSYVIPAQAGIQFLLTLLDSRLRGSDGIRNFLWV
jgi:hypothetical protein